MSGALGSGMRDASPSDPRSGRDSPVQRISRQLAEQGIDPKDKAFRRYALAIEKALASFELGQQEWADYISFLAKLHKAIQLHPSNTQVVPDSYVVANRLAQCMSPNLPSGVHQKTLEVYRYLFEVIGKENLGRDIHLYLPGLAPVLSFAALSVRPLYLRLLETYFLPLGAASLRSPLKSIIMCLLPGLEDETSEDYDEIMQLMNNFRNVFRMSQDKPETDQDSYFWQCFFLATITNISRRQGALLYLTRELPKFSNSEQEANGTSSRLSLAAEAALHPEPGLLIRCLSAGLTDSNSLVQRGFLDLLVTHLPLDSLVLQEMVPKVDLDRLVTAAISVVSRRDMSLNRRLWTWLLGPESNEDPDAQSLKEFKSPIQDDLSNHAAYFGQFGLQSLTRGIGAMLKVNNQTPAQVAKPFKLCLSLMDKWEVGGLLIPDIFIPALQSAFAFTQVAEKPQVDEVVKSASQFFDGVESGIIWAKFNQLLTQAFKSKSLEIPDELELAEFITSRFNIREEEMITHHIPQSGLFLLAQIRSTLNVNQLSEKILLPALDILERMLVLVPSRVYAIPEPTSNGKAVKFPQPISNPSEIIKLIDDFYETHHGGLDGTPSPFPPEFIGQQILREATSLLIFLLINDPASVPLEPVVRVVNSLMGRISIFPEIFSSLKVIDGLLGLLKTHKQSKPNSWVPFRAVAGISSIMVAYQRHREISDPVELQMIQEIEQLVIENLWNHLSPYNPKHHVEAVKCLWQLETISPDSKTVEAGITTYLLLDMDSSNPTDAARRFSILWTQSNIDKSLPAEKSQKSLRRVTSSALLAHAIIPSDPSNILTRPLMVLLDHLEDEGSGISSFLRTWLREVPTISRVFIILISQIRSLSCVRALRKSKTYKSSTRSVATDSNQCLYYLKILLTILKHASESTWMTLAAEIFEKSEENSERSQTLQLIMIQIALRTLDIEDKTESSALQITDLHRISLELVATILQGPYSRSLKELNLQNVLLQRLVSRLDIIDPVLQPFILEVITVSLRLQLDTAPGNTSPTNRRKPSKDVVTLPAKANIPKESLASEIISPPSLLIDCLKQGIQSPKSRLVLDSWIVFLVDVLPIFADTIFQNVIPLVECICAQINSVFTELKLVFQPDRNNNQNVVSIPPESTLIVLLNGLEHVLANAHEKLQEEEGRTPNPKSPDQPQGFFGTMVQGVWTGESQSGRATVANNRLTVLLCFQDAVRTCFSVWRWGVYSDKEKHDTLAVASYGYTSLRMRNRARRLLEHLFAIESLECLETLAHLCMNNQDSEIQSQGVLGLLNVLNGSKPMNTIPAIFNAIYTRTNPSSIDASRQSSLTTELKDTELVAFLIDYTQTLDDDSMDEIWNDCSTFLKDVLANPLPHNNILPALLLFVSVLAEKMEKTNFGEQRRTRKELGDLFSRLLAAIFTTRSMGFLSEPTNSAVKKSTAKMKHGQDIFQTLLTVIPLLKIILVDNDRVHIAVNSITANVTVPTLRAKSFPLNITEDFSGLLLQLTKTPQASKLWKKDVSDAFNDHKFFSLPLHLIQPYWLPIIHEYVKNDNDRLTEILARITAPTTAGIVFGVGATSARLEADRRTQLNLRRIALMLLSSPQDAYAQNIVPIQEKIVELLLATPSSSPSSVTRSEIYILLRAIFLKISTIHLGQLWPVVNAELQYALVSVLPDSEYFDKYTNWAVIQAAKLLDTLVALDLDEFQLHEWLYITDTIDAVYRPPTSRPTALLDCVADALAQTDTATAAGTHHHNHHNNLHHHHNHDDGDDDAAAAVAAALSNNDAVLSAANGLELRKPVLDVLLDSEAFDAADLRAMPKADLAVRILRPFLGQLSLLAFEATYGMLRANVKSCTDGLIKDIFEDRGAEVEVIR